MDINQFDLVWLVSGAKFGHNKLCLFIHFFLMCSIFFQIEAAVVSHTYSKHYNLEMVAKIIFHRWTDLSELIDIFPPGIISEP